VLRPGAIGVFGCAMHRLSALPIEDVHAPGERAEIPGLPISS
jgi:hypothetical protein